MISENICRTFASDCWSRERTGSLVFPYNVIIYYQS